MKPEYSETVKKEAEIISETLKSYPELKICENSPWEKVLEAENYALSAGGKHVRGVLAVEFYKLFSGMTEVPEYVYEAAGAIEMTHTFSLIHDDMPEMDDDDMRRGKPAVHIVYGNAIGLLAGDGLSILPFEIISRLAMQNKITKETALKLINELSRKSGNRGMIAGQVLDLWSEERGSEIDEIFLRKMSDLKTGRMLEAACIFGALLAGADDKKIESAKIYAENIGLAFQIVDDILDVTSTEEELGKPIGSDSVRGKPTFADILGIDGAHREAVRLSGIAASEIMKYPGGDLLSEFAEELSERKK